MNAQHWEAVMRAGLLAPSADNRHGLRFVPEAGSLLVEATDVADWDAQPHRRVLSLVSIGAVVENMVLRAGELGTVLDVRWLPQPQRNAVIASLTPSETEEAQADPLARAIEARHTNRRFYRREPLPESSLARIAAAGAVPGAWLRWLDGPHRRPALAVLRLAESERFRRQRLHAELFQAVRFDAGWRDSVEEGLPPGALEIEPPVRPMFAALRHWPLMRALAALGVPWLLGLRAGWAPCALAPHLGLIAAQGPSLDTAALQAGRALERAWLAAAAEDVAMQPMAAAVALVHQRAGAGWVAPRVQRELRRRLAQLVANPEAQAFMLLRLGRAEAPSVVTGRTPLQRHLAAPIEQPVPSPS